MKLTIRTIHAAACGLMLTVCTPMKADELTFVVPSESADIEGDDGNNPSWFYPDGYRWQSIIDGNLFSEVPTTHLTMTSMAFRPDGELVTSPLTRTWEDVRIRIGTTKTEPDAIDQVFATNLDNVEGLTTVYDGSITFSTEANDNAGGPRNFDYKIEFQQPVHFDPREGNLFTEFDVGPFGDIGTDGFSFVDWGAAVGSNIADATEGDGTIGKRGAPALYTFELSVQPGDFNGDGVLDAVDIDLLRGDVTDPIFDLTNDGVVDQSDRDEWVHTLSETYYGDANLDGVFDQSDFVVAYTAGQYEDDKANNSGWEQGDWNGDREFTSGDLIAAMEDGGYEQGPRTPVNAVPEPSTVIPLVVGLWFAICRRRQRVAKS